MEDYERQERRRALLDPAMHRLHRIRHLRAQQHLAEGFNRRVLMIETSLGAIRERVRSAGTAPLEAQLVSELAIQVNAFWLNLCGALDNLAWAFQYETKLLGVISETRRGREAVGLFRKPFLDALQVLDPSVSLNLQRYRAWYLELRALRDPAAHRIPLYPVPGITSSSEAAEVNRLYNRGTALLEAGHWDEGLELIRQGYQIGEYQPWMAVSHSDGFELRHLGHESRRDEEAFIAVSEIVLSSLFSDSLQRATD